MKRFLAVGAGLLLLTGCVKRTILIESTPPGARVWINEHYAGTTPVKQEFITHGRYRFRINKEGFREQTHREWVRAPVYQWIPIDFITDNLIPYTWQDHHPFHYALEPLPVAERLQMAAPPGTEDLRAALRNADPAARRAAVVALARARPPEAAELLEPLFSDPAPEVRAVTLHGWRVTRGPDSLDRLVRFLGEDPDPAVRWQAATELEALGDPAAVPALIAALADRDSLPRGGAAEALKGIPDRRAVPALIRELRDLDAAVRRAAAEALGKIGDRTAVPALSRALFHRDVELRRKSVEALALLRDPSCSRALVKTFTDWDPGIRTKAAAALVDFGSPEVVPLLIRYLRGWKTWTRLHAAYVLGGMKVQEAAEPIRAAMEREPDENTRGVMRSAIAQIES
ncbi:MAG: hypothetical protein COV76_07880 [Candidatus Omnitrophica bacterium CG11_big_fil_rev_8_21_14_0_20_64_10]|nr:MAG: hypothetical protein COV76_07880 [Candidatus Omnitrophica bacterium CG11_big_fil_rev_8_21_14_0_20_64_10]